MQPQKIVYLFGAGATHAELMNTIDLQSVELKDKYGLLISDVSSRVMKKARHRKWFKDNRDVIASTKGAFNIELYISLLEANNHPDYVTRGLKDLVRRDIRAVLSSERKAKFYLHKALLELHLKMILQEELLGFISLNYDPVLDDAYRIVLKKEPEFCLTSRYGRELPLLKLHGSFNWESVEIYGRFERVDIIPIGMNKNYLSPPYNFIWGRAFELLTQCDILRVIGCSLNPSDFGLIDLLFKAHYHKHGSFEIQIIDYQPINGHHQIKKDYGFFPNIVDPGELKGHLLKDSGMQNPGVGNPFKIWLIATTQLLVEDKRLDKDEIAKTRYLSRCLN